LINQTLASIVGGAGQASQIVVQQLLNLVGIQSKGTFNHIFFDYSNYHLHFN